MHQDFTNNSAPPASPSRAASQLITSNYYRREGVVVRACASQSVDLRFIPQVEPYQKTLKNGIHSFPAWRSPHRDSVEIKPASLLVVSLGKTLNRMSSSLCGRQMVKAKQSTRHGDPV